MTFQLERSDLQKWLVTTKIIMENLSETAKESLPEGQEVPILTSKPSGVFYRDQSLVLENMVIPLGQRPLTDRLVRGFFERSEHFLSKEEILTFVYNVDVSALSERRLISLHQNLLKLLSRSRSFLRNACRSQGMEDRFLWFCFDQSRQKWSLYKNVVTYGTRRTQETYIES